MLPFPIKYIKTRDKLQLLLSNIVDSVWGGASQSNSLNLFNTVVWCV